MKLPILSKLFSKKNKPREKLAFAYIGAGGNTVVWTEDSYEQLAQEAYIENVIFFQCVNLIARMVCQAPWKVGTESPKKEFVETTDWKIKRPFIRANKWQSLLLFLVRFQPVWYP